MPATIIDGKVLAAKIKENAAKQTAEIIKKTGVTPKLIVYLLGDDAASSVYVRGKAKDCAECGIASDVVHLPSETTQEDLLARITSAGRDDSIHGILVQLPLPKHIDEKAMIEAINPAKDVDGFTPINVGKMHIGEKCFLPCTPAGCLYMIEAAGLNLSGKDVVVVGRSNIVGKPAAALLLSKNATVTICHSKTQNLAAKCAAADVIIAAAGQKGLITANMVKAGATVIDVGMNRDENGKLCGDVDFEAVREVAGAISPVPGGTGLMTRAMLMENTVKAAKMQLSL